MKKNLKKLALNKKAVSNLTGELIGGFQRSGKSDPPFTCTQPTPNTMCYHCPANEI